MSCGRSFCPGSCHGYLSQLREEARKALMFKSGNGPFTTKGHSYCLVPACDGVELSPAQRRELWAKFYGGPKTTHAIRATAIESSGRAARRAVLGQRENSPEVAQEAFCRRYANGSERAPQHISSAERRLGKAQEVQRLRDWLLPH